jgi:hypothetical protein
MEVRMRSPWLALLPLVVPAFAGADPLLLQNGRFAIAAHWSAGGQSGVAATGVRITEESAYFTFFAPGNVELVVKVLDGCAGAKKSFWVFAAGLTNVDVVLDVSDQWSGEHHSFHSPAGKAFAPILRTDLFATCGTPRPCGSGNAADIAASPREDWIAEPVALFLDRTVAATQATYERVHADLAAIHTAHPELAGGASVYFAPFTTNDFFLGVDAPTFAAMENGTYHAWDCLNAWYGVSGFKPLPIGDISDYVVPRLGYKVLYVPALLADYRALPGITSASVDGVLPPPLLPRMGVCAAHGAGDEIAYYFFFGAYVQFRSRPGSAPVEEPYDAAAAAACN